MVIRAMEMETFLTASGMPGAKSSSRLYHITMNGTWRKPGVNESEYFRMLNTPKILSPWGKPHGIFLGALN